MKKKTLLISCLAACSLGTASAIAFTQSNLINLDKVVTAATGGQVSITDFSGTGDTIRLTNSSDHYLDMTLSGATRSTVLTLAKDGTISTSTVKGATAVSVAFSGSGSIKVNSAVKGMGLGLDKYLDASGTITLDAEATYLQITAIGDSVDINELTVTYACDSNVPTRDNVIDGIADDSLWINGVTGDPITISNSAGTYAANVKVIRDSSGVYAYAKYAVEDLKAKYNSDVNDYWQGENLEIQFFPTKTGLASDQMTKFYVSKRYGDLDNDKKLNNVTSFAYSPLVQNPVTELYEYNVELFISWAKISEVSGNKIAADTHFDAKYGFNENCGWRATGVFEVNTTGSVSLAAQKVTDFDGQMNESYWSSPCVESTKLILGSSKSFTVTVYFFRDYYGVHVFGDYTCTSCGDDNANWYKNANIEFTRYGISKDDSTYCKVWTNTNHNGFDCGKSSKIDHAFSISPQTAPKVGIYYSAKFEFFISYETWFDDASYYKYTGDFYFGRIGSNFESGNKWTSEKGRISLPRITDTLTELLDSPVSHTASALYAPVFNHSFTNPNYVAVYFSGTFVNGANDEDYQAPLCELFSPSWTNGGITMTCRDAWGSWKDNCGWSAGIEGYSSALNNWKSIKTNMTFMGTIVYNNETNEAYCDIRCIGTSSTGHEGRGVYTWHYMNNVTYDGTVEVNIGMHRDSSGEDNQATITINSVTAVVR